MMYDIDPDGFYTIEQAAKFLMQDEPELSFAEAYQIIRDAIDSGELQIADMEE